MVKQVARPIQPSALKRVGTRGLNLLVGGRAWLQRQLSCLWRQGRDYLPALRVEFESAVDEKMEKLEALEGMEQTTKVTIEDAARCYYTEHWSGLSIRAFKGRRLLQAVVILLSLVILVVLLGLLPHPPLVFGWSLLFVLYILLWLLALTYVILQWLNALVRHKFLTAFIALQAFLAFVAVDVINVYRSFLEDRFQVMLSTRPAKIFVYSHPEAVSYAKQFVLFIQDYFWCVAVLAATMGIGELIRRHGWSIVGKDKAIDYDWPARQNAELIIRMLDTNYVLHNLLGWERPNIEMLDIEDRSTWFKLMTKERVRLRRRLNQLVTTIVKPWRTAMWSSNGAAGRWVADQAPRIAFFIEHYQTRMLLTGRSLIELQDAMSLALRQAVEGNWHLIGAEFDSAKVSRRTRWANVLRRFLAIIVAALLALVAFLWKSLQPQVRVATISTCGLFILLQVVALIDPDAPGLANTANSIIGGWHKSGS
jgi:hypothetical protein